MLRLPNAIALGLLLGAVAAPPAALPGQSRLRIPTAELVREGRAKAELGDTAAALELLERATDQSPRDADALYWRSLVMLRTTELGLGDSMRRRLASKLLDRAADLDPDNPRYLLALGRLRLRTPLRRVEAERIFRKALAIAERTGDTAHVAEASRELGEVKRRRYLTGRDRRMYTGPNVFDPLQARERSRMHYTREFIEQLSIPISNVGDVDRIEAEEYFRRALRARPDDPASVLPLLDLLYDQRRYDEMLALIRGTITGRPAGAVAASPRVHLAEGLAAFRLQRLADAEAAFNRGIALMLPGDRDELLNLGRILRRGDSVRVAGLADDVRARTDSAYWEANDPLLATPENEARLEFLSRMAYADLHFTDEDMRQAGWRTDRAMILARYGEPPVVATFSPQVNADARDAIGRVITVWYYPRPEVEFVFSGPPAFNYASFAGNYRDYAEERREIAPFGLENLPLALRVDTIPVQVARFRGTTPRETELVVASAVPAGTLYADAPVDRSSLQLSLRAGPAGAMRLQRTDTIAVQLPAPRALSRTVAIPMRADDVRARLEAIDPSLDGAVARAQVDLPALRTDSTTLARALVSSDLLIARRIPSPPRVVRWPQLRLEPLGDLRLAQRDTFSVYWELYGLQPGANGRLEYELQVSVTILSLDRGPDPIIRFFGGVSDLVGLSPVGDDRLSMRFTRDEAAPTGPDDRQPELITLGLGTSPAGRYRLTVTVTDRRTARTATSQRDFAIVRP
ncbi:MAG: GWxTD domain-containing protein [Gemmatimonadaceae bacterium]|nr:GWxTD domain-containing protein [Gemmatimonadota bacterium]